MKYSFYRLIVVILFITTPFISVAQSDLIDVVYLKNGSIIKGIITEQVPGTAVKIQTADGSLFVFEYDEITKMTREPKLATSAASANQPTPVTSAPATSKPKDRDEWGRTYNQNMELATRKKSASIGLLSSGSVLVAGSAVLFVLSGDKTRPNTDRNGYLWGGIAAAVAGIPLLAIGGGLWSAQLKYRNRAENMAPGSAQLSPVLIGTQRFSGANVQSGAGVGVQLTFRF
jgi:hypothetical protein